MKMLINARLVIFFFLTSVLLQAEDIKVYNIGLLEINNDIRYDHWGIHPVDIRSKYKKKQRPFDGALLAIEDSKKIKRLTKTSFSIERIKFNNHQELLDFFDTKDHRKYDTFLLDLDKSKIVLMEKIIKKNKNIIFFNVSDPSNSLRKSFCAKNLFHSFPSNAILTDSISQYLVKKKFNNILLLTGPLKEDKEFANSFKISANKFGLKIIKENFFVNSNDPRIREKNSLSYLTSGKKYKAVFVSDVDGEFALSVPNSTMSPSLVTGASGLIANTWHWSYLRHGAPQLNGRFERLSGRRMTGRDWAAWISIKTLVETILRIKSIENNKIINFISSENLKLDGSKGISLSFKIKSNQLRQTIFLTSSNNWVTAVAPLEEFQNSQNNLDTLGISIKKLKCKEKNNANI